MKGNFVNNPHYLNIHMIGESLYLLELYLSRNIYTVSNSINKKKQNLYLIHGILIINIIQILNFKLKKLLKNMKIINQMLK